MDNECDFLLENIGSSIYLQDLEEHLHDCPDCQQTLTEYWQDYYQGDKSLLNKGWCSIVADWSIIPPNLGCEEFLAAWHSTAVAKEKDFEHCIANIKFHLSSEEGFRFLNKLFTRQARALRLLELNAPQSVIVEELKLLTKIYTEFRDFLGAYEFAYLTNQNPEDFDALLRGWQKALLGSEAAQQKEQ